MATMLHSTSSGTELLLRSQHRTSPVHNKPKSRIIVMVAAGLILVVISATLVSPGPIPEWEAVVGLQHTATAWLTLTVFSFGNINTLESAAVGGFPAVVSGAVGRWEAMLSIVLRESNKTDVRRPGNDYDLLYYI
ncbi:hypothetical protein MRX96_014583 [Rhipicephalus microplus]